MLFSDWRTDRKHRLPARPRPRGGRIPVGGSVRAPAGGPERGRGGGARSRDVRTGCAGGRGLIGRGNPSLKSGCLSRGSGGKVATMNTVLSRANSLFAFSLSVMAALTFGCFITTAFKDRSVPVRLHVSRIML